MTGSALIPFWILPQGENELTGYGVTAFSLRDALHILENAGYPLPENRSTLRIAENVRVEDLDEKHVIPNMGPIIVRGIWYPFTKVGT